MKLEKQKRELIEDFDNEKAEIDSKHRLKVQEYERMFSQVRGNIEQIHQIIEDKIQQYQMLKDCYQ